MARSYKTDESFLEKIAIGAVGTRRVFDHLTALGHKPVALDRGSMSFKLWKAIKIKRLRVPDILCVTTGIRVESRAKTKLEISMSHSEADPQRGWDFGLAEDDYVALPYCARTGEGPLDWTASDLVQYVKVHDLRDAVTRGLVITEKPKGAQEGFEVRLTWPASIASSDGTVSQITPDRLQFRRSTDNRTISLSLKKRGLPLTPLVETKDTIHAAQILAAVVPVHRSIPQDRTLADSFYIGMLKSPSLTDRYAAAKALSFFQNNTVCALLADALVDPREHIYVKLEAAATLMQKGHKTGRDFICQMLEDDYLAYRLETVIVLSELPEQLSCGPLLKCLLDDQQDPEIRAGAAWALGEIRSGKAVEGLLASFNAVSPAIQIEAARALAKVGQQHQAALVSHFPACSPTERPGLAWALARVGNLKLESLLPAAKEEDARHWLAYMIGRQQPEEYSAEVAQLRTDDPELYFAVNVLWKILTSWVHDLNEC